VTQPVTYADVWEFWLRNPQLADEVDFITVHMPALLGGRADRRSTGASGRHAADREAPARYLQAGAGRASPARRS
jgi:hypothetical protein